MVSMTLINAWQSYIGEGKYTMPICLMRDKELLDRIETLRIEHQEKLKECIDNRTDQENPQCLHKVFKGKMVDMIRKCLKK